MTHVALLRGINVGGNNKIAMPALKECFERLGHTGVFTYINSGNVIFTAGSAPGPDLAAAIEVAISRDFGLDIPVVLRDQAAIEAICAATPAAWVNETASMKTDVMFLMGEADQPAILEQLPVKPGLDQVRYAGGAVIWNVARENLTRSGMMKIVGTPVYRQMTIRNINTVRKLATLL